MTSKWCTSSCCSCGTGWWTRWRHHRMRHIGMPRTCTANTWGTKPSSLRLLPTKIASTEFSRSGHGVHFICLSLFLCQLVSHSVPVSALPIPFCLCLFDRGHVVRFICFCSSKSWSISHLVPVSAPPPPPPPILSLPLILTLLDTQAHACSHSPCHFLCPPPPLDLQVFLGDGDCEAGSFGTKSWSWAMLVLCVKMKGRVVD